MSLELGYGSIIERYQKACDAVVERYQQGSSGTPLLLESVLLTEEELSTHTTDQLEGESPPQLPQQQCHHQHVCQVVSNRTTENQVNAAAAEGG